MRLSNYMVVMCKQIIFIEVKSGGEKEKRNGISTKLLCLTSSVLFVFVVLS